MSTNECPVNKTKLALKHFYTDESKNGMCSKCHPCKLGIYDAIQILDTIQAGKGEKRHVSILKRIAQDVKDGSMCKKGKDHADILSNFMAIYAEDLCRHVKGICDDHECTSLISYDIKADKCTMCGKCQEACPSSAIEGQKIELYKTGFTPFRIRQKRCTHCGECLAVCPEGAVFVPNDAQVHVPAKETRHIPAPKHAYAYEDECIKA
jgi:formate hydrogenlyase subunit 6/NADH:ubiquinone oxidoreductase subunit I